MKPVSRKKVVQSALLLALCALGAVLIFSYVLHRSSDSARVKETAPPPRAQSGDKSVIRGLRYSAGMGEEARLFIEADEFRIGKKKIGFLRVSLLNEAEIRNARIRIVRTLTKAAPEAYGTPEAKILQTHTGRAQERERTDLLMDSAGALLNEIESAKAFPGMSSTRIVSIKIAPVDFQILEGNASLLKISAGQAGFDLKNRSIVFRDRVRVSAGKEAWTGDELRIDPDSGKVTGRSKGGAAAPEKEEDLRRVFSLLAPGN